MTIFVQRIKLRYRHGKDNEKGAAEERRRTTEKRGSRYTQEHLRHHLRAPEGQGPRGRHGTHRGAYHGQSRNGALRNADVHPPRPLAAEGLPHRGQEPRRETNQRCAR